MVGLGVACLSGLAGGTRAADPAPKASAKDNVEDARALAARIDHHIAARWQALKVKPAPPANDAAFFRRVYLDLGGRIPSLTEIRDFIDDDRPDKRWIWVEQLLESETYANHFANVWRHLLLPQNNNFQVQFFANSFEGWLRERLKSNTPYDQMVRELVTAPPNNRVAQSPSAFLQANELKPENLAASTSRLFLGHKLECAQCHDHPFAKWTRQQFWEYTAFFSGITPQGGEQPASREIKIAGTDKVAKARFLDGTEPAWKDGVSARTTLAEWMTRADNPYFARATVNRVWAYFFGTGLIDPVDEESDENPPSHPELLDELAKEFAAHHFDLKFLIRAIVASRAYQLSSVATDPSQKDSRVYGRRTVRGLSPEQLFDSLCEVTDFKDLTPNRGGFDPSFQNSPRAQFLNRFSQDKPGETETSILQALFMMNGKFMSEATSLSHNKKLEYIANSSIELPRRIEQVYLIALSRKPTAEESARLVKYVQGGGKGGDPKKAFEDILWALLNSAEFMLNH
jgi:hypothetical protein